MVVRDDAAAHEGIIEAFYASRVGLNIPMPFHGTKRNRSIAQHLPTACVHINGASSMATLLVTQIPIPLLERALKDALDAA